MHASSRASCPVLQSMILRKTKNRPAQKTFRIILPNLYFSCVDTTAIFYFQQKKVYNTVTRLCYRSLYRWFLISSFSSWHQDLSNLHRTSILDIRITDRNNTCQTSHWTYRFFKEALRCHNMDKKNWLFLQIVLGPFFFFRLNMFLAYLMANYVFFLHISPVRSAESKKTQYL